MTTYHKIKTVFKRDPDNNNKTLLEGEWAKPEFGYLADLEWEWTEKIDGMNMRVLFSWGDLGPTLHFAGRSDAAQIPVPLQDHMDATFDTNSLESIFGAKSVTLYGEGFGGKIQKGGERYGVEQRFVLFDALVDGYWLERPNLEEIAEVLEIPIVPLVGRGSLLEMVELVRGGLYSIAGDEFHLAEGIVARPRVELVNRYGERVITKLKAKDFA